MTLAARHMQRVASTGCVVCRRIDGVFRPAQLHHVAEGSGVRSDFATVALCEEHHDPMRSGSGFHGMGTERFCKLFRVPGEAEWGLLVWQAEDLARYGRWAA